MDEKGRMTEQMPQTIGRYQVLESIGFGAMGAVYKAFDPLIKRTLAIKTIRLDIPRQSPQYKSFIERFYHEARISGTLSHPNIVTLFDIGEEGGVPYLAMEFVEGETIASLLDKGLRFAPEKVIGLISQIASAVDYAHSRGVIHRDIKPSNLILYEGDRVKVTDFGIAKLVDAEMTQSGTLLGTPSYMSPEQAMGDKLDGRSDMFSLGVCAFEMLSGEQPFPGNNVTSILYKLVHVDPIEPPNLEMHGLVPQKWHEVFSKVLAKRPDDRYQTATEFVQDLEFCLGSWFGAMGEETLLEPGGARVASTAKAAPPLDDGATVSLPRVVAPPPPVPETTEALPVMRDAPAPTPPPRPAAAAADDAPLTVQLKAQAPDLSSLTTPLQRPPAAVLTPPPLPPSQEKTILMNASALGLPPAKPTERVARPAATDSPATIVMNAPPAPAPRGSDVTMRTAAPPPPPVAPTPPAAARPAPPPPTVKERTLEDTLKPPKPPAAPVGVVMRPPAGSRGLPVGLILGGAGLAFVVAVVVAGIALYRSSREAPAPEPSPTPPPVVAEVATPPPTPEPVPVAPGVLRIQSNPSGATITVNGESRGTTPLDLGDLEVGIYEVKAELKGFVAQTRSVVLSSEQPQQDVAFDLARPQPSSGLVDVISTPFGAAVRIDGASVGETPLTGHRLKPGTHRVEVSIEGHQTWSGEVQIEAGKRARLEAQLLQVVVATPPPPPPPDVVDTSQVYQPGDVDTPPRKLKGTASYPSSAPKLRSGESASVSVSFVVTPEGEVEDPKIMESGGKILDEAVLSAVRDWKYSPGVKKGVQVKVRMTVKQTFRAG
jgi:TonB family protein